MISLGLPLPTLLLAEGQIRMARALYPLKKGREAMTTLYAKTLRYLGDGVLLRVGGRLRHQIQEGRERLRSADRGV